MAIPEKDWELFRRKYEYDPAQFVRDILLIEPYEWQAKLMNKVADPKSLRKRFAVRSGHRVGKSAMASWLIIWHILTKFPQKTAVTAPTQHQLMDALFAECKSWIRKLPPWLRENIEFNKEQVWYKDRQEESFVSIKTTGNENTEALAGAHSAHTLLIADEGSAIPIAAYQSAASSMAGPNARMLMIGNPTRNSGYFYDVFNKPTGKWDLTHVSSIGIADKDWIDTIIAEEGEESNQYRIRVLGQFPLHDDDALISAEDVELAMTRTAIEVPLDLSQPLIYGVDISRFGDDLTVLVKRRGRVVLDILHWKKADLMATVGRIKAEADSDHPSEICIDSIGVGGGVADRLRELKFNCFDVNVAERAAMNPKCERLRDELWWSMREYLQKRDVRMPRHDMLKGDLIAPTYQYNSNGKVKVESKDSMKSSKRLGRSPDFADALGCTFAGVAAMVGSGGSMWRPGTSHRRGLSGIV